MIFFAHCDRALGSDVAQKRLLKKLQEEHFVCQVQSKTKGNENELDQYYYSFSKMIAFIWKKNTKKSVYKQITNQYYQNTLQLVDE